MEGRRSAPKLLICCSFRYLESCYHAALARYCHTSSYQRRRGLQKVGRTGSCKFQLGRHCKVSTGKITASLWALKNLNCAAKFSENGGLSPAFFDKKVSTKRSFPDNFLTAENLGRATAPSYPVRQPRRHCISVGRSICAVDVGPILAYGVGSLKKPLNKILA